MIFTHECKHERHYMRWLAFDVDKAKSKIAGRYGEPKNGFGDPFEILANWCNVIEIHYGATEKAAIRKCKEAQQ